MNETENKYYTAKEFSKLIGVHEVTVRKWIMRGQLEVVRFSPRCVRIPSTELERLYTGNKPE